MITDIANLGPPLRASSDLSSAKKKPNEESEISGPRKDPDSFAKTLGAKKESTDSAPTQEVKSVAKKMDRGPTKTTEREDSAEINEASAVKVKKGPEEVQAKSKGQSERERVMLKFTDSMESEFGIPPTKIVEAMTQLPDQELISSPEDTASQVIQKLDLDPKDEAKAMAMYMAMLSELSKVPQQPKMQESARSALPAVVAGGAAGLGMAAMSTKERSALLNQSLERMNQKFFMQPLPGQALQAQAQMLEPQATAAAAAELPSDYGLSRDMTTKNQIQAYKDLSGAGPKPVFDPSQNMINKELPQAQQGAVAPSVQATAVAEDGPLDVSQLDMNDPEQAQLAKGLAALGLTAGALSEAIKKDPQNHAALKMESQMLGPQKQAVVENAQTQSMMKGHSESSMGQRENKDFLKQQSGNPSGLNALNSAPTDFFVSPQMPDSGMTQAQAIPKSDPRVLGGPLTAGAAAAQASGMPPTTEAKDHANIQQIMNQAQYMIKKGGGEAIVKMNPEGLGQVHMRVTLSDGKVNLQMATETKEAKQAIENSIGDLKANLSTHKMTIDHVKVDVGNQLASDNNNSSQQQTQQQKHEFKHDEQRENARQFLGNFREDNSGSRDSFQEMPGIKAYGPSRRTTEALKPNDEVGTSRAKGRYTGERKGSGLDLVA